MKICFICADPGVPVFGRKGCSTHVRETCLTLIDQGHEVRLICSNTDGDDAGRDRLPVVKAEPYRSKKLGFDLRHLLLDRRIEKVAEAVIGEWKPDAIYERYSLYSRAGTKLAERHRLPHILEINAFMTREQADRIKLLPLARRFERKIIRAARHIVVVSEPLKDDIAELRGTDREISRMPMAVNLDRFNPAVDGLAVRSELGLENRFVIGYVGMLTGWHGIALLYDLANRLREAAAPPFTILVVGGDARRLKANREKVEREGLSDAINFYGPVPHTEVPRFIRAMDVALVPDTTHWSSPAKLFEYQGCGVPVVAPLYPAIENAMKHGEEGWIFPPRDIAAMAEGIQTLAGDPELRRKLGRAARARAETDHSWDSLGRAVIDIFVSQKRNLAARSGAPSPA